MSKIPNYREPRAQLEGLLTATQQLWRKFMDGDSELPRDEQAQMVAQFCAYFSAAWYLRALMTEAPEQAGKVCESLQDILEDGGGVGEWTWDLLSEMGIDPDTIAPADGEFVRTGDRWPFTFWHRDDVAARAGSDVAAERWWDCAQEDGGDGPHTWDHVASLPDPKLLTLVDADRLEPGCGKTSEGKS